MSETSAATPTARESEEPAQSRRWAGLGTAAVLVPIGAWGVSLAGSYVLQAFSCLTYASAGVSPPEMRLGWVLVGVNVAMLIITLLAGVTGLWVLRRAADGPRPRLQWFLGFLGAVLALVFAFSIVLIGFQPLFLEVC